MIEAAVIPSDYEIERDKPMPSKHHSFVQSNLNYLIRAKYKKFRLGSEISLDLSIRERVPDIGIFPQMPFGEEEIRMSEPPLGVVEILSPTQSIFELIEKRREYFTAGVKSYWLVFPELRSVYIYSSPEDYDVFAKNGQLQDRVLGIELDLEEVFA